MNHDAGNPPSRAEEFAAVVAQQRRPSAVLACALPPAPAMILREPPLVEMPIATSSGRAWAINCRRKIDFGADVVGDGGDVRRFHDQRNRGNRPIAGGGTMQSIAQSLASVAEPPLPNRISFPPRSTRSAIACGRLCNSLGLLLARPAAAAARRPPPSCRIESATSADDSHRSACFCLAQKGIEKAALADVVSQFAMLEEHVHCFPQRVIQNLDHFLMNERIGRRGARLRSSLRRRAARSVIAPRR